jgi:dipeptidyl-peptidase 4
MRAFALLFCSALAAGAAAPLIPKESTLDTRYLRDHAQTRGFLLGRPVRPKVTPDGKTVLFLRAKPRIAKMSLFAFDVASGKTTELLTPETVLKGAAENLTPEEKARRERQRVTVGGFATYHLSPDGKSILVSLSGRLYLVERASGKVNELKTGKGTLVDPKFSPDGKLVSYVLDHDVFFIDPKTQKETRVTKGGTEKKTHGLAEFVAQEEMGRFTGYWWSPDSKRIAYEESDAAGVETWYVADPAHPEQKPLPSSYPRPGKANVKVRLGVVGLEGGKTVWVEWDRKKYEYLANVHWQKVGGLTLTVQTRDQQELLLLRADAATGKTTTLLKETDPAWLNLNHDRPHWLADGSFLWQGEGKQGPQLELRDKTGALERVVVPASAGFLGVVHFDAKNKTITYRASADPTQQHLYRLSLDSDKPTPLSKEPGIHSAVVGKTGVYVHTASLLSAMPRSTVYRADGTKVGELPSVAEEPPFVVKQEISKVGKGPGFYTTVIRPRDFDKDKKYPAILHVYGGPGHQEILAQMSRRLIDQWLADQGFIIVAVDGRGTPGRGRDWERAVFKKFAMIPLDDQVAGLEALGKKYPELDTKRVGIYGWSFGGYMAALAVQRRPDVFRVGVAGAPVTDWYDYDTHYTERYLGIPPNDAYTKSNLVMRAKLLAKPFLLVHGTADDNVLFEHSLRLIEALEKEDRAFQLMIYPGKAHGISGKQFQLHVYKTITDFFDAKLR